MKKKWMLCVGVLALVLLMFGVMTAKHLSVRVGTCIKTENGGCMLLMEDSPVVLSGKTAFARFDEYRTGDRLLVLHDGILETYPGRTGAYLVIRLHKGDAAAIPQEILAALTEMGWMVE